MNMNHIGTELLDFSKECELDIASGNRFIVEPFERNIKKDIKSLFGIFSHRFSQTLIDANPYIDRYKCRCIDGQGLKGILASLLCPRYGHLVEFVDDNFAYFG